MDIKLDEIENIAFKAGEAILDIYNKSYRIQYKDDKSPLTEADLVSNKIICNNLLKYKIPILSEESRTIEYSERKKWDYFWCIDPIDGTKEFLNKNDEFTINIALIRNNYPILGVVYAPALGVIYSAKENYGVFQNQKQIVPILNRNDGFFKVVASKSHMNIETQEYINNIKTDRKKIIVTRGSSLKICSVAIGEADCYPRLGKTMEWDTAAADIIVKESGKKIYNYHTGNSLKYNKECLLNPYFVVQ